MLIVSLCLELLASVGSMLLIIAFGISDTGPLVTDVFTLAIILYFIVLFKSFILLIKHYFIDQGAITRLEEEREKQEQGFLSIRTQRKTGRIAYDELCYVESLADYVKIHRTDGSEVLTKEKISHIEEELPETFLRIHRSFIVNTTMITSFNREEVILDTTVLPVSRTYRKAVMERLKK
jgi:DNA-binding LytR/AlgR family response regulator